MMLVCWENDRNMNEYDIIYDMMIYLKYTVADDIIFWAFGCGCFSLLKMAC